MRLIHSSLVLLVLAACTAAPSTPVDAGSTDAGTVDAGEVDAGDGTDPQLETFTAEAATAVCTAMYRCCDQSGADNYFAAFANDTRFAEFKNRLPPNKTIGAAECPSLVQELFETAPFGDWVAAAKAKKVTFKHDAVVACTAKLNAATCGKPLVDALNDGTCFGLNAPEGGTQQRSMFERTQIAGDACTPIRDGFGSLFYGSCDPATTFCCVVDPMHPSDGCTVPKAKSVGVCKAVSETRESCQYAPPPIQLCASGLTCDSASGKCLALSESPLKLGDTCASPSLTTLGECGDSWCDLLGTKKCAAFKANGESCNAARECESSACEGSKCVSWSLCEGGNQTVTVEISPATATIAISGQQQFTATVTGASDESVTWSVVEVNAGNVSSEGLYTAPSTSGTYHVRATSNASTSKYAEATVTVTQSQAAGAKVSTFAGDGSSGTANGTGTAAKFNGPSAVVFNGTDLIVADSGNNCLRKITVPGAVVTTFAGTCSTTGSFADGDALTAAKFRNPTGLAVLGGKIYVTDRGNHKIRVIENGQVSTLAGGAQSMPLNQPTGIAVDAGGTVYVSDASYIIRSVSSTGTVTDLAGTGTSGATDAVCASAQFHIARSLAMSGTTLYVADTFNNCVRAVTTDPMCEVVRVAGQCDNVSGSGLTDGGAITSAKFDHPYGIAMSSSGGLLVADSWNNVLREVAGGQVTVIAGAKMSGTADGAPLTEARFNSPYALAEDVNGDLYVADYNSNKIRRFERK